MFPRIKAIGNVVHMQKRVLNISASLSLHSVLCTATGTNAIMRADRRVVTATVHFVFNEDKIPVAFRHRQTIFSFRFIRSSLRALHSNQNEQRDREKFNYNCMWCILACVPFVRMQLFHFWPLLLVVGDHTMMVSNERSEKWNVCMNHLVNNLWF